MKAKRQREKRTNTGVATVRASISFPSDVYESLENIASGKKVSLAWVVRDAAEKYIIAEQSLLVKTRQQKER